MRYLFAIALFVVPLLFVSCSSLRSAYHYDADLRKFERVKAAKTGVSERTAYYDLTGMRRKVKKFSDIYNDDKRREALDFMINNIKWTPPRPRGSVTDVQVTISLIIETDGTISNFRLLQGNTKDGSFRLKKASMPPGLAPGPHPVELTLPFTFSCYCEMRRELPPMLGFDKNIEYMIWQKDASTDIVP